MNRTHKVTPAAVLRLAESVQSTMNAVCVSCSPISSFSTITAHFCNEEFVAVVVFRLCSFTE